MATTLSSRVFRAGRVLAPDSKWTGEEPEWKGWEEWPIEKFYKQKSRMLNFYGYYLVQADLKPQVLAYMKQVGYPKTDIALVQGASPNVMPTTVGKLIRAMDRGMPPIHPDAQEYFNTLPFSDPENPPIAKDDRDIIKAELYTCLQLLRTNEKNAKPISVEAKNLTPSPTIQDKLRIKVDREIIYHLDEMLDRWILGAHMTRVEGLSMTSFIRDGNIPASGCKPIIDWIEKQRDEYQGALDKSCPQLVEGYEHMSKPAIKNRITTLELMLAEVVKHSSVAKGGARKPRVKKMKDAGKQIARLQYQVASEDYDIKSIDPVKVPAAQRVYVFNTKTRGLGVYYSTGATGFEVKGTSLKNFDAATSYITTLRKPKEVLDMIISNAPKLIDKHLEAMQCKKKKANGRINAQTVLVRVVENRV